MDCVIRWSLKVQRHALLFWNHLSFVKSLVILFDVHKLPLETMIVLLLKHSPDLTAEAGVA